MYDTNEYKQKLLQKFPGTAAKCYPFAQKIL